MMLEGSREYSDENDSMSEGEINTSRDRKRESNEDFFVQDERGSRGIQQGKKGSQPKVPLEKPLTMELLEELRLSRKSLALLCSYPIFEQTVKGAFVRVNQSSSSRANADDYLVAEVIGIQDYPKYYPIDEKETNKVLLLKHGSKERPMKMCFVSNGNFTGVEFTRWINRMQKEEQRMPTMIDINRKKEEIQVGLNFHYSDNDIRKNIDERIQEKLRKGESLTYLDIEILENRKIGLEKKYWSGEKDVSKLEIERLSELIKKAKKSQEDSKRRFTKREENKNMMKKIEEMFKAQTEFSGLQKINKSSNDHKEHGPIEREVIEKDEEDMENEKILEEIKKRGISKGEMYAEIKRDFIKAHKVDLNIDKIIDEWEIGEEDIM